MTSNPFPQLQKVSLEIWDCLDNGGNSTHTEEDIEQIRSDLGRAIQNKAKAQGREVEVVVCEALKVD